MAANVIGNTTEPEPSKPGMSRERLNDDEGLSKQARGTVICLGVLLCCTIVALIVIAIVAFAEISSLTDDITSLQDQLNAREAIASKPSADSLSIFRGAGYWSPKAAMTDGRSDMAAVTAGRAIFLIGGLNSSGAVQSSVVSYDPLTNEYESKAAMPGPRMRFGAAYHAASNLIFVVGGFDSNEAPQTSTLVYDVAADEWTTLAMETATEHGDTCAAIVGNQLYVVSGYTATWSITDVVETLEITLPAQAEQADFNVQNGKVWQALTNGLPTPRGDVTCVSGSDRFYVAGGYTDDTNWDPVTGFSSAFESYTPATGSWAKLANMKQASGDRGLALHKGRVLAIGGETHYYGERTRIPRHDVESYDPDLDVWVVKAPVAEARFRFAAAAFEDEVYVFGGHAACEQSDMCHLKAIRTAETYLDVDHSKDLFYAAN